MCARLLSFYIVENWKDSLTIVVVIYWIKSIIIKRGNWMGKHLMDLWIFITDNKQMFQGKFCRNRFEYKNRWGKESIWLPGRSSIRIIDTTPTTLKISELRLFNIFLAVKIVWIKLQEISSRFSSSLFPWPLSPKQTPTNFQSAILFSPCVKQI